MILELAAACVLSATNERLVARTLEGWSDLEATVLALPAVPPPAIILVDLVCRYDLHPDPDGQFLLRGVRLGVTARAHGDSVRLPNGATLPVAGMAFMSLDERSRPFFLAALPDVWAADPKYRDEPQDWNAFLLPVLIHEFAHTRQLATMLERMTPAIKALGLRSIDDDVMQNKWSGDSAFTALVLRERDLFLAAATARRPCRQRTLVRDALVARAARHGRYLTGADSSWRELETRFLDLEGLGQWASLQFLMRHAANGESSEALIERVRDNKRWWSQEYGLALYLALDRLVPHWHREVFPPALESAFVLLARHLDETGAYTDEC